MKNKLFHYKDCEEIKTFANLKEDYAEEVGADLPIPNDDAELILIQRLVQNGGNIVMINDKTLAFLHKLAIHNEAERFLNREEQMESIRDLYCDVQYCVKIGGDKEALKERLIPYRESKDDLKLWNELDEILTVQEVA